MKAICENCTHWQNGECEVKLGDSRTSANFLFSVRFLTAYLQKPADGILPQIKSSTRT